MIWSLILFQAILMKATVSFTAAEDNSFYRSVYLVTRENKHLADHVVKQFESPSLMSCSQSCLRHLWCTSTNFKPKSSERESKAKCELNKHEFNPINDKSKLVDQPGTIFSMFLKGCLMSDCLNGGSCRFDKNKDTFTCSCKRPWSGDNCEVGNEIMNSPILSTNESYFNYLGKFLESAVGKGNWLLCWRATLHGWNVKSQFHKRCDGKRNTVTVIQVKKYVFGGYTDIPWESSGGFSETPNAFIFSLNNKEGLAPFKSNVTDSSQAIFLGLVYGPDFGNIDIEISNDANRNGRSITYFGSTYSVPTGVQNGRTILAGNTSFTPDEVEVFYLDPSH